MVARHLARMAAALVSLAPLPTRADAHPLHTTLTQVTDAADGSIQIVLRAFVDDFSAAVTGKSSPVGSRIPTPSEAATARYLGETLRLFDRSGQLVRLTVTSIRRTDDLVWVTLQSSLGDGTGVRLTNRVLFDRWDDQVNIVQTTIGGRRQTLLFTLRERNVAKTL